MKAKRINGLVRWIEKEIGLGKPAQFAFGVFIVLALLLGGYSVFNASAIAEREIQSTVQLITFNDKQRLVESGSGTVIDADGHVLTNYHVIKSALTNKGWTVAVCVTPDAKKLPTCGLFMADLVAYSEPLDLALLALTKVLKDDGQYIDFKQFMEQNRLRLGHVKLDRFKDDDEGLALGDQIMILGYPDAGGSSITVTRGIVSGFEQTRLQDMDLPWLVKTDAKINPGNSGGGAFDAHDDFVGLPKAVAGGDGNIGYIVSLPVVNYFLDKVLGAPTPQTGLLCADLDRGYLGSDNRCYCNPAYEWSGQDKKCVSRPAPGELGILTVK